MSARLLVLLLVPALLLAQALGLVHGVQHARLDGGPVLQASHAVQALADHAAPAATAAAAEACDDSHDHGGHDAPTCRLVDQLMHGDIAGSSPVLAVPVLQPPLALLQALAGLALARWAALFDARGPPASR